MWRVLIICAALSLCAPARGQSVRIINATAQDWSGGIAGRSGCNYYFEVAFDGCKPPPLPDTLWLGAKPIPLTVTESPGREYSNTRMKRKGSTVIFEINGATARDESPETQLSEATGSRPPIAYSGVALLSYKYGGREHYFVIRKIKKRLLPAEYP